MNNAINWFEIPTTDFERALAFYRTMTGYDIRAGEFMGAPHGFFPVDEGGVGGAIISRADAVPSMHGALIYLNAGNALNAMLARVAAAGGQVLLPATVIGEQGVMAIIRDPEGNRVGLHAPPVR